MPTLTLVAATAPALLFGGTKAEAAVASPRGSEGGQPPFRMGNRVCSECGGGERGDAEAFRGLGAAERALCCRLSDECGHRPRRRPPRRRGEPPQGRRRRRHAHPLGTRLLAVGRELASEQGAKRIIETNCPAAVGGILLRVRVRCGTKKGSERTTERLEALQSTYLAYRRLNSSCGWNFCNKT